MNLTDMIKQPTEGNRPKTDFMNMRKFEKGDRLSESVVGAGAGNTRGIDNLIQGLVDLLPKRDGIWPLQERANGFALPLVFLILAIRQVTESIAKSPSWS